MSLYFWALDENLRPMHCTFFFRRKSKNNRMTERQEVDSQSHFYLPNDQVSLFAFVGFRIGGMLSS